MVQRFYGRVREDEMLGPVFRERLGDGWDAHLDRMVSFWSSVLRGSGGYRGNPIQAHRRIPGLDAAHFDRWLDLFRTVVREVLPEPVAVDVHRRAARMRRVLQRHLDDAPAT